MPKRLAKMTRVAVRWIAAMAAALSSMLVSAGPATAAPSVGQVTFSPEAGPIGTAITLTAHLTRSERAEFGKSNSVTAYIAAGQSHAGLETTLPGRLIVASDGAMRLRVVVPLHADWRANPMSGVPDRLSETPAPTVLELAWPCRACGVGTFQVTAAATVLPFTGSADHQLLVLAALLLATGCLAVAAGLSRRAHPVRRRHPRR